MSAKRKRPTASAPLKGDQIFCERFECHFPIRECIQRHIAAKRARASAVCRDCIPILDYMPLLQQSAVHVALSRLYPRWVSVSSLAKKIGKTRDNCKNEIDVLQQARTIDVETVYNHSGSDTAIYRLREAPAK